MINAGNRFARYRAAQSHASQLSEARQKMNYLDGL